MRITGGNRLVAFTRIVGAVRSHAADVLIGRDLVQQFGQHGASPMLLLVTSIARTSSVSSSIPMCILRQTAALGASVLACVPLAFTFGLDASAVDQKVQWPCEPLDRGWRTDRVRLTSAQGAEVRRQPSPARPSFSKLATNPVVCRSGKPNNTLSVRQA